MTDPMLDLLRRDEEERTFESACRITAKGEGFLDANDVWQPASTEVYAGPCSFLEASAMVRTVNVAGAQTELYPYTIKVPASVVVEEDQVVEITACPDPQALGFYTIRTVGRSQWTVNRVLGCEKGVT